MTAPAAITGTFSDLKIVKTRSVVQIIIESPLENAHRIIEAFGFPQPGAEVPVAIALLKYAPKVHEKPAQADKDKPPPRRFKDMPRSQQAALACQDISFIAWLCRKESHVPLPENAVSAIYRRLGIKSRAQLDIPNAPQAPIWDKLYAQFQSDTGRTAEVR